MSKRSKRTIKKLRALFEKGDFYEAEQLLKTFHKRLNAKKEYADSRKLLIEGANLLFDNNKGQAGVSVCDDLLDTLKLEGIIPCEETVNILIELFLKIPDNVPLAIVNKFLKSFIDWLKDSESSDEIMKSVNGTSADFFKDRNEFTVSSKYYLRHGDRVSEHAALIRRWSSASTPEERDYFICRVLLQYLCLGNQRCALRFLREFNCTIGLESSPMINFICMFLRSVNQRMETVFDTVQVVYRPVIEADSDFASWIAIIGQMYFARTPKQASGLLGQLMSGLTN